MKTCDIIILTDHRFAGTVPENQYMENVLLEDQLVRKALEKKGLKVERHAWDDPEVSWEKTSHILFRSTWDYFDRFPEFEPWLEQVKEKTRMINPYEVIRWNLDKHYLLDLQKKGIHIPPTLFIEKGDRDPLLEWISRSTWDEIILKPVVSGGARHTYRFMKKDVARYEEIFGKLIREESMMIQEFQQAVPVKGEAAFMLMGGRFTHAILKKAKPGDFRVQDDFGGTVHRYEANGQEISFAEQVLAGCDCSPAYGRLDVIWDNDGKMAVSELELIEPELWFRFHPEAADLLADTIINYYF